jgi:hypothetical protein
MMTTTGSTWPELVSAAPELASFAAKRLAARPCYLATIRTDGTPRVHPVTPIVAPEVGLFVFMEPTSPKGLDLLDRRAYALHTGVSDNAGTGGEVFLRGEGEPATDPAVREIAVAAASYDPADHYVLFHLTVTEIRANGYGDTPLPAPRRWRHLSN